MFLRKETLLKEKKGYKNKKYSSKNLEGTNKYTHISTSSQADMLKASYEDILLSTLEIFFSYMD